MQTALLNSANICYQNSLLMVFLWLKLVHQVSMPATLDTVLDQISRQARTDVGSIPEWSEILSDWGQPLAQHDVAEFCMHVFGQNNLDAMTGMWSAFQGDRNVDEFDLAQTVLPLALYRSRTLQQMINQWHDDGTVRRFLLIVPDLIVLQILRFKVVSGRVRKLTSKVDIPLTITLPSFENAMHSSVSYSVVGGIFHLGGTPSSGHYRAFVKCLDMRGVCRSYVTDDNQHSIPMTAQLEDLIRSNVYLLFCLRQNSEAGS